MKKILALLIAASLLAGCDDEEALQRAEDARRDAQRQAEMWREESRESKRAAEEAHRERAAEARSAEQKKQIAQQQAVDAEAERSGAITMMISTAIAFAVVILLLARERYLRRTFVKMARMIFARGDDDG